MMASTSPHDPAKEHDSRGWRTLKLASSSSSKILKHVNSKNIVGEDLKFAADSLDNRLACALQIAVYLSREKNSSSSTSASVALACTVNGTVCSVQEWEPARFGAIRASFGVDPIEYRAALGKAPSSSSATPEHSTLRFVGAHAASGKSFSWFLFSPDMRYCCKTMSSAEASLLLEILPSFEAHCAENAGATLLPHFLGLYCITLDRRQVPFAKNCCAVPALGPLPSAHLPARIW
jgi:hypothetical protein